MSWIGGGVPGGRCLELGPQVPRPVRALIREEIVRVWLSAQVRHGDEAREPFGAELIVLRRGELDCRLPLVVSANRSCLLYLWPILKPFKPVAPNYETIGVNYIKSS